MGTERKGGLKGLDVSYGTRLNNHRAHQLMRIGGRKGKVKVHVRFAAKLLIPQTVRVKGRRRTDREKRYGSRNRWGGESRTGVNLEIGGRTNSR